MSSKNTRRATIANNGKAKSQAAISRPRSHSVIKAKSSRLSINDRSSRSSNIISKTSSRRSQINSQNDLAGMPPRRPTMTTHPSTRRASSNRFGPDNPRRRSSGNTRRSLNAESKEGVKSDKSLRKSRTTRISAAEDRQKAVPLIDPDGRKSTLRKIASLGKSIGAVKVDTRVDGDASRACELLGVTKKDLRKLRVRFDVADADGSGEITRDEFFKMVEEKPSPFGESVFRLIDVDCSDGISFNELVQVLTTFCIFNQTDILYFIFQQYDRDGSGSLDEFEFIEMITDLNTDPMFPGNIQKAFESFDANADGLIDFDEFKELNRRYPMLTFPIFRLQDQMQRKTLGQSRWTKILREKAKRERIEAYKLAHDGDMPPEARSGCFGFFRRKRE